MISVPFQHYKSSTTLVGIVWLMLRRPTLRIVLMTHSHEKAKSMGKDLRELCKLAGISMKKGFDTIDQWTTEQGGGCVVISSQQSALGYPCDLLLVDDPLDENEYMMSNVRDRVDRSIALYTDRCASHLNSVLIVASRWHPDDPIGRRSARTAVAWEYIRFAGIIDYGLATERAFAPDVLSLERHHKLRAETFEVDPSGRFWYAQMQNDPLPDALGFFVGHTEWLEGNTSSIIFGVDAAFTAGKKSDYFACVGLSDLGDKMAVFTVIRHQRGLVAAVQTLVDLRDRYVGARFVAYTSGPEVGVYHAIFQTCGVEVEQMPARWNKGVRAQKAAKAWTEKKILTRVGEPWTGPFLAELHAFDGSETNVDDQTDALVAAHDAIAACRPVPGLRGFTFGRAFG